MTVNYVYDQPTAAPQDSSHWLELPGPIEDNDILLESLDDVKQRFQHDLALGDSHDDALAVWSCLLGYCEAITTHKQRRYSLYPIPYSAMQRLVASEFVPPTTGDESHRAAAQSIANWVWSQVKSKSNVKDELHANSMYTVLRGQKVDGKSLDCFGAAVTTVIGLRSSRGFTSSTLTLSEDHAYESHTTATSDNNDNIMNTCEVAIPGNTLAQRAKRGREIADTFREGSALTPTTSWLYMGRSPVRCDTTATILAAVLANVNPMIECNKKNGTEEEVYSEPLLELKRELLWILYDRGALDRFPFALCELGWTEEHVTSFRGEERVTVDGATSAAGAPTVVSMTKMEALYHQAVSCSQTHYHDLQVYPYCYLGYFHKDSPQEEEYRSVLALQYFAEAARVASSYQYEWGDSLQLTKVMTKLSVYIAQEILSRNDKPREWINDDTCIAVARELSKFFDHLLLWEEKAQERFLPILQRNHKTGIQKAFSLISYPARQRAYTAPFLQQLQSQRIKRLPLTDGPKLSISEEAHLSLILASDVSGKRQSRKRKPPQR